MASLDVGAYAKRVMACCRDANKWVADLEPWKMKDDSADKRQEVLRLLLEACYALSLFLAPLAPRAATFALRRVGGQPMATSKLKADFSNLQTGARVTPANCCADRGRRRRVRAWPGKKKKVVSKQGPSSTVTATTRRRRSCRRGEGRGR